MIRGNKRNTDQRASTKHRMEGLSLHNSSLIGRKNQATFENNCISRNEHRLKIYTQPNIMILVSFSSAVEALSNDVNKYNTFSSQGTENPRSAFFLDTRYAYIHVSSVLCPIGRTMVKYYIRNQNMLVSNRFISIDLCLSML